MKTLTLAEKEDSGGRWKKPTGDQKETRQDPETSWGSQGKDINISKEINGLELGEETCVRHLSRERVAITCLSKHPLQQVGLLTPPARSKWSVSPCKDLLLPGWVTPSSQRGCHKGIWEREAFSLGILKHLPNLFLLSRLKLKLSTCGSQPLQACATTSY